MATGSSEILRIAQARGATVCFANPGTTELPIVEALETAGGVRAVLCLFEGVCTGAADGFSRVTSRPALTLLHLGPGLANGMANLHNARRAHSSIVNLIGDHPAHHLPLDSPLTSDILAMASTVSDWWGTTTSASLAHDVDLAFRMANSGPGGVSTLVVPVDVQTGESGGQRLTDSVPVGADASLGAAAQADLVSKAARLLQGEHAVLYLGGKALRARALRAAHRIQHATGCKVFTETFASCQDRGRDVPRFPPLPYFPEAAAKALSGTDVLVSVGAHEPVAIFDTPGTPGRLAPLDATRVAFDLNGDAEILEAIADEAGATEIPALVMMQPFAWEDGDAVSAESIGAIVAGQIEEDGVLVQEAATNGYGYERSAASAAPHISLALTGGAIGIGLPLAVGAAIGQPGRRVIALQADGSAMYTNQALWTMVRENLDVTVVLLSNSRYSILQTEMKRFGSTTLGPVQRSLTSLVDPTIDWVSSVQTPVALRTCLARISMSSPVSRSRNTTTRRPVRVITS